MSKIDRCANSQVIFNPKILINSILYFMHGFSRLLSKKSLLRPIFIIYNVPNMLRFIPQDSTKIGIFVEIKIFRLLLFLTISWISTSKS